MLLPPQIRLLCILLYILLLFQGSENANEMNFSINRIPKDEGYRYSNENEINGEKLAKILKETFKLWRFNPNYLGLDPYKDALRFGYPAEKHIIETDDGYLLTVLRIPHGIKKNNTLKSRPIVYMQPGLFCSAACFTDFGPGRSLGYILADAGYDVWITNPRGTTFSRNHTIFDSMQDSEYWDFSWHEIGTIDVPNTIDYILETTEQKELNYIGHSQGTTVLFVMLSEMPKYNSKIKVALALAPVTFIENFSSAAIEGFALVNGFVINTLKSMGIHEMYSHNRPLKETIQSMCSTKKSNRILIECTRWLSFGAVHKRKQIDPENIRLIIQHFPAGASVKQIEHYSQLIKNGGFTKFDYGKEENLKLYGQSKPPSYDLSKITTDIYLIFGETGILSDPEGVQKLHSLLPTSHLLRIENSPLGHNDFLFDRNISQIIYRDIEQILYEHNQESVVKN